MRIPAAALSLVLALAACDGGGGAKAPAPSSPGPAANGGGSAPETKGPAAAPAAIDPATAGAVRGRVVFEGTPPAEKRISVAADPYCQSMHPEPLMTEVCRVGKDGALANAFVWVKKGLEGRAFDVPATPAVLDQVACRYVPHVLGVRAGQPILIRNSDDTLHNVHALPKLNPDFNFGQSKKGEEALKKFTTQEVMVRVKCDVHGWMSAYVGVVAHPYFQVTGEDGAFALKNLPPGDYVVEAWHEKLGTQQASVTLGAKEEKEIGFTFKGQ